MVVPIDYFRYICDYNQIEMNKLTTEELQTLRELNQSVSELKGAISDYEIKKYYAIQRIMNEASRLNSFNEEIEAKYGPININIETGEYASQENSGGQ